MIKQNIKVIFISVLVTAILTACISVFFIYPTLDNSEDEVTVSDDGDLIDGKVLDEDEIPDVEEPKTVEVVVEPEDENTVNVDKEDYEYLMTLYDKYEEIELLQEFIIENYYLDVSDVDFVSEMTKGLFDALGDPYSQYYTPEEFTRMLEDVNGSYEGIGVVVAPGEDGFITVVSPISTSPGFEAGLKTNDKIIKVDGVEYFADELSEAVKNIRGPKGTEVILTVRRGEEEIIIPVTRREIEMESVQSEIIEGNIGYVRISMFDEDVSDEFLKHYNALNEEGIDGLIIDLRYNGGGYLNQCIELTDLLMDKGVIVKTKDRAGHEDVSYSQEKYIDEFLVVITNEGSASASEILTGAIKDNEQGIIVGTTTFGKGLVQTMRPLYKFDNAGFKLTIEQYFTPDNHYIHGVGIEPNVVVEDDPETEEDEQLEKAIEIMLDNLK